MLNEYKVSKKDAETYSGNVVLGPIMLTLN